tara:strand:- start:16186 stop:17415 length:1230 start_codon:yes stop_codon:yes gene_type:complete
MEIYIQGIENKRIINNVFISGSKSESNRLLILQKLFDQIEINNLSDSDDTHHLIHALSTKNNTIDIGHAGTAMRFLTSYFALKEDREVILTGSERMQNRPIEILVNALKELGASISYESVEGYPPIKIKGRRINKNKVQINGNVSSQYISSLLLISSKLENGLEIKLIGEITSIPYIKMTLALMNQLGIETTFKGQIIKVHPLKDKKFQTIIVESDWSSASYFYSIIALSEIGSEIRLSSYKKQSLQGDSVLASIYMYFGVTTIFRENEIVLKKNTKSMSSSLKLDLNKAPDIAQTIAVTCFGLGVSCELIGLHTLKIKETDRLEALQKELTKLGALISVTDDSLFLEANSKIFSNISIETYNDHRMAMAFAPLGIKVPIKILDAEVVTKSYRNFWKDLHQIGFQLNKV